MAKKSHKICDKGAGLTGISAVIARAAVPEICGDAIQPAPARGPFVAEHQSTMVPVGIDEHGLTKWAMARTGYGHRASIRAADAFDRMIAAALRRKQPWPLTPGQIAMGRRYAGLSEALAADGIKLSSLDQSFGGGDGSSWIDRRLQLSEELELLRKRIGPGAALSVRRVRPSDRGADQRGLISDRILVDMVCLRASSLDAVLVAHGWKPDGRTRKAITAAMSAALDRMIGYRAEKMC